MQGTTSCYTIYISFNKRRSPASEELVNRFGETWRELRCASTSRQDVPLLDALQTEE